MRPGWYLVHTSKRTQRCVNLTTNTFCGAVRQFRRRLGGHVRRDHHHNVIQKVRHRVVGAVWGRNLVQSQHLQRQEHPPASHADV